MANGTLAASQFEMLSQSGTGIITVVPPATNTNRTLTLPDLTGTVSTLNVGTAVALTSGTSIDFTGIPAGVKRITVMFNGMSTNGSSSPQIQLGDSGGIETSGYAGTSHVLGTGVASVAMSSGFVFSGGNWAAAVVVQGAFVIQNISGNTWVCTGAVGSSSSTATYFAYGGKTLSDTLTQLRITMINGTDTFDAGTINIMYEG